MTVNQQMFLCAVEEMNFTKAAKRAYVTQQCLSDHIRRLEESYGVKLFHRTPKLALTQAGELLYQALCQIAGLLGGQQKHLLAAFITASAPITSY